MKLALFALLRSTLVWLGMLFKLNTIIIILLFDWLFVYCLFFRQMFSRPMYCCAKWTNENNLGCGCDALSHTQKKILRSDGNSLLYTYIIMCTYSICKYYRCCCGILRSDGNSLLYTYIIMCTYSICKYFIPNELIAFNTQFVNFLYIRLFYFSFTNVPVYFFVCRNLVTEVSNDLRVKTCVCRHLRGWRWRFAIFRLFKSILFFVNRISLYFFHIL